jgi:oligoendopeptidase F
MYASMLALEYFRLYKERPDWFLPRYRAFLENGFDDTPQSLLKKFLAIDLDSPSLLDDAVHEVDGRLKSLEASPAVLP